jgi:hypothetical protein
MKRIFLLGTTLAVALATGCSCHKGCTRPVEQPCCPPGGARPFAVPPDGAVPPPLGAVPVVPNSIR